MTTEEMMKADDIQKKDNLVLLEKLKKEEKLVKIPLTENDDAATKQLTEEWKSESKSGKSGRPVRAVGLKIKQEREQALAEARIREREAATVAKKQKDLEFVSPKLAAWIEEFGKNGGDATKAAIAIGSYTSHASAVSAGGLYLRKAIELGMLRSEMEKKGYNLGAMISVLLRKMEEAKGPEWWDRAMKMSGYGEFAPGKGATGGNQVNVNVIQTQQKIQDEFGFAEEGEVVEAKE